MFMKSYKMWLISVEIIGSAPRSGCVCNEYGSAAPIFLKVHIGRVRAGISKSKVIYCEKWMRFGNVAE
jgi:hypothetical protein